jgi:hypothetical protein
MVEVDKKRVMVATQEGVYIYGYRALQVVTGNDTTIYSTTSTHEPTAAPPQSRLKLQLLLHVPLATPSSTFLTSACFADPFDPRLLLYLTYTPSKRLTQLHALYLATVDDRLSHTVRECDDRARLV